MSCSRPEYAGTLFNECYDESKLSVRRRSVKRRLAFVVRRVDAFLNATVGNQMLS